MINIDIVKIRIKEFVLRKFRTKNFKNFEESIEWDLTAGKSNLTYAVMDITLHLTDFSRQDKHYVPYRNLNSK